MLKVAIVDDEIPVLNLMKMFLEKINQVNVVGSFNDPNEALKKIIDIRPDVVFLDIEMPEINGLELASQLIEQNDELMVVFVTAYNQYALEAFHVNALDYILKPVNPNTIQKCISRLIKFRIPKDDEKPEDREKKICCFDDFNVYGNKGIVKWPTRKVEEMFAYFIIHRESSVEGWLLGETLWAEDEPDKIKANLHTSIYRLRKTIKENDLPIEIYSEKGGKGIYRCSLGKLYCDLIEFKSAISKNVDINDSNINKFEQTCLIYKEDLFLKKNYLWCENQKEYLQKKYINILENMASFYEEKGLYQKAIDKLLIIKTKSPFHEEMHRRILKLYAIQNNRALLIKCHEEFKSKLFKEIGIEPQTVTHKLFLELIS